MAGEICCICNEPINKEDEMPGEPKYKLIDGERVLVHQDCYFDELGDAIEEHPIGRGTVRGGMRGPID